MAAAVSTRSTEELLKASAHLHNAYPPDTAMPRVDMSSDGVEELCRVIIKFRLQSFIRLRLLHRHFDLPEGQILLERRIQQGYRTKPTPINEIKNDELCGYVFSVKEDSLSPTEFRQDSINFALDNNFAAEFTKALRRNKLETTLGIEVARNCASGIMLEFSSDSSSVLLHEDEVKFAAEGLGQCTTWVVTDGGVVDQTGETRCHIMNGKHTKITSSQMDNV